MKTETFTLELITPCFCAGADQAVAEVRAPSFRGKLRWWFRILGGSFDDEAWVFGSVAGENGQASALTVRVSPLADKKPWQPINFAGGSNTGYLLYFAKASGNGARWNPKGALPEGARFSIQVVWRREIPPACGELFDLALDSFLMLGSLGLRSTRGL
ncbi:MAG TPA: type III-B CRISPR module RAMP protein Cmr1, partial [Candidatus Paceibacterota bacterium]|nr:type III-B CRISPR module RAMP protein Cmr1 [Candidatus Paceibacterota bacterium]